MERRSGYRWAVLSVYTLVAGVSQMLWLNFAPLLTRIQTRYGVSELLASTLVVVFPLLYVLLSIPAGALVDRRGYRFTVGLGGIAMALFSCLRVYDASFYSLLAGQIGIAAAQPFVVNGISKLVSDWFDESQGAIATGLGTMGMFIGMAVGMAATPPLAESLGLRGAMVVFSIVSAAAAAAFVLFARESGVAPRYEGSGDPVTRRALRRLLVQRDLVLVFILSFLGLGFFNGLTTWLEAILAPQGIEAVDAGMVGGLLVFGGIVGAVVIPALSDRFRRRKPFLLVCTLAALPLTYPLCISSSYPLLLALGGALGFFFLPAYALLLEMSAELAGEQLAGSATGILMLTGNAGGVVVTVAMQVVKGDAVSWLPAVYLMLALLLSALVLAVAVRETFHRA